MEMKSEEGLTPSHYVLISYTLCEEFVKGNMFPNTDYFSQSWTSGSGSGSEFPPSVFYSVPRIHI
jgi:hypothetical protein